MASTAPAVEHYYTRARCLRCGEPIRKREDEAALCAECHRATQETMDEWAREKVERHEKSKKN